MSQKRLPELPKLPKVAIENQELYRKGREVRKGNAYH